MHAPLRHGMPNVHARGIDVGQPKPPILPVKEEKAAAMIAAYREMGLL